MAVKTSQRERIEGIIQRIETSMLLKLRTGECDMEDLQDARDIMNCTLFTLCHRRKTFSEENGYPAMDFATQVMEAGRVNHQFADKYEKVGHVVAKFEEYELLLDTLEACCRFCKEQLEQCPAEFVLELNAAKMLTASKGRKQITVSYKTVDWAYEQAVKVSHMSPRAQETVFRLLDSKGIVLGASVESLLGRDKALAAKAIAESNSNILK